MSMLHTKNITKQFGGVRAVDQVSVSFTAGSIVSVIGPNGSGKSTLINVLTGVHQFSGGEIYVGKHTPLTHISSHQAAQYGITRTFQNVRLFDQMPVIDNVLVALTERNVFRALFETHHTYHQELAEEVLKRVHLWEKRNELAANLSYGQRKLLEVARVLAMDKRTDGQVNVIFLDEPFAGLFPQMRDVLWRVIEELKQQQKAVVLVEHNMDIIRNLSDYVYVLDTGTVLAEGAPGVVLEDEKVINAYFGY